MSKLQDVLQEVQNEIGSEFIASDVVGSDGLSIAGISTRSDFDSNAAAARFAMVMKLASKVSDKLQIGTMDDNLVTTSQGFILSRFLGDGSYYWNLAVTDEATLGVVRMVMNDYAEQLWDVIPR